MDQVSVRHAAHPRGQAAATSVHTAQLGKQEGCVQRELQSLNDLLYHACACNVVRAIVSEENDIDLPSMSRQPHNCIRLNRHFRSDQILHGGGCSQLPGIVSVLFNSPSKARGTCTILSTDASGPCMVLRGLVWTKVVSDEVHGTVESVPFSLLFTGHCDNVVTVSPVQFRSCRQQHIMLLCFC